MKNCPYCGKKFNLWQRATGEDREHMRYCCKTAASTGSEGMASVCRGCPAGCFEKIYDEEKR